jgi:hypothetical protein
MNLTSTLLKAGALYAIGRFASNVSADDVAKVTGISGDDLKRYGLDRTDALLGTMGLQRQSTVPSSTALVLSGFAAGAIVGAGVTFLFYSEQGKDVRKKIGEYFSGAEAETAETGGDSGAHAGGNGEAKATA